MQKFFGKYRGKVESNDDPQQLERLQISVPLVLGDNRLSWAMPCVPYAGPSVGLFLCVIHRHSFKAFAITGKQKRLLRSRVTDNFQKPDSANFASSSEMTRETFSLFFDEKIIYRE